MAIDPYRTLGLTAAASLDEVKRAYRRLAKQYHPDAAGDEATRRFLAVQAAYEAIVDGAGGPGRSGPRRAGRPGGTPPWQADPARARATREAYRARGSAWRASGASPGSTAGSDRPGPASDESQAGSTPDPRAQRRRPGADAAGHTAGDPAGRTAGDPAGHTAGDRADGTGATGRSGKRSSSRRKATLTSTSYDEAPREPFEPDWDGGSWYGTSSGTYWTINPKEYADPRKHGPEYQARARRASVHGPRDGAADEDATPAHTSAAGDRTWADTSATWGGSREDPIGATSPQAEPPSRARADAATPGAATRGAAGGPGATGRRPGDRPPTTASPRLTPERPRQAMAAGSAQASPLAVGLRAGALAVLPSGIAFALASTAGASAAMAVALLAPPIVGIAAAALTARRVRAGRGTP